MTRHMACYSSAAAAKAYQDLKERIINPTIYSPSEHMQKLNSENDFLTRLLKQPKIFIIGNEHELGSFTESSQKRIKK